MDLLSVVMHEMGHLLGYEHEQAGVMQDTLAPGTRMVSSSGHDLLGVIDLVFAELKEKKD